MKKLLVLIIALALMVALGCSGAKVKTEVVELKVYDDPLDYLSGGAITRIAHTLVDNYTSPGGRMPGMVPNLKKINHLVREALYDDYQEATRGYEYFTNKERNYLRGEICRFFLLQENVIRMIYDMTIPRVLSEMERYAASDVGEDSESGRRARKAYSETQIHQMFKLYKEEVQRGMDYLAYATDPRTCSTPKYHNAGLLEAEEKYRQAEMQFDAYDPNSVLLESLATTINRAKNEIFYHMEGVPRVVRQLEGCPAGWEDDKLFLWIIQYFERARNRSGLDIYKEKGENLLTRLKRLAGE